jgi:hypothetical protein
MGHVSLSHRFEHRWLLEGTRQAAYDVLVDVERYPEWWPQIRAVAYLGPERALVVCRSVLPFSLHLELEPVARDPERGILEVAIDGDLVGWSRFTLTPTSRGLDTRYEQEVETRGRMLDAARLARPLVRANHTWMMRSARAGLTARLADLYNAGR